MPIQSELRSDGWYVTGLTPAGAEAFAGQRLFEPGDGWFVGFDDSFADPLVVRAYYDAEAVREGAAGAGVDYVGIVQFVEVAFLGQSIPPDVLGGAFADRAPYAGSRAPYTFVDFMGPAQALMLQPASYSPLDPFFALNGALVDGSLRRVPGSFTVHPLPNGSLSPFADPAANDSLAASMVTEVSATRISPRAVARGLSGQNRAVTIPCTAQQLAEHEAYEIALDYLMQPGQELNGIDLSQVGAQVVGEYVLLTLPDPEATAPVLCVSSEVLGGQPSVCVYLLDYDDLDTMQEDADIDALNRIHAFMEAHGLLDADAMQVDVPGGRGQGGLGVNPFRIPQGVPCLELRYRTWAFARKTRVSRRARMVPLSGVSWAGVYVWDEDTRTLQLTSIRQPELVHAHDHGALVRYGKSLVDDTLNTGTVDTSYFANAAMRRHPFGAGLKPVYIDPDGERV